MDDDNDTLFTVGEILQNLGYETVFATNGVECLNNLEISIPDLVLLDIMMPKMDGFETIKKIRSIPKYSKLLVIALTAHAMLDDKFIIESSLTSAIELLKKIDIIKISSPETIAVGENGVFSASMKLKEENRSVVWNNISIKVTFRDIKKGAVIGERFAFLRTDEKGFITFVHPPPGYTGMGRVEIELDLFRDSEPFDPLEENYSDLVQKLKG